MMRTGRVLAQLLPQMHRGLQQTLQHRLLQGCAITEGVVQHTRSVHGCTCKPIASSWPALSQQQQQQHQQEQQHAAVLQLGPFTASSLAAAAAAAAPAAACRRRYHSSPQAAAAGSEALGRLAVPCPSFEDVASDYQRSHAPEPAAPSPPTGRTPSRSRGPVQAREQSRSSAAYAAAEMGSDPESVDPQELALFLRQQHIEPAALPPEIKRSVFTDTWDEYVIQVKRTAKVTKSGRLQTSHVLLVVGNMNGLVGIGSASGSNLQQVMMSALAAAYKNIVPVARYRAHTIYHHIDLKQRKLRIQMWPRHRGWGVVGSPLLRGLCRLAGIKDLTVQVSGRRKNRWRLVELWLQALQQQSLPHEGVEGTGVYVREVWAGKKLPLGLRRGVDVP